MGELYTFYLVNGKRDYFTSLDVPITFAGNVYKANSIRISGLKFKLSVGVDVDEQDIKIAAYPWDTLGGGGFITSALDGALDGGYMVRDRLFWTPTTGIPAVDYLAAPALAVRLAIMRFSTITKGGRTWVEMKLKSPMVLLNIDMPRNPYSPSCLHTLFDAGCTLSKAAFGRNGVVGAAGDLTLIQWSGGVPNPTSADGLNTYAQGRVAFLSGPNQNTQFSISGDDFIAYVGCSKTSNTCTAKFNNAPNWRGYDLIPPVYTAL